MKKIFLLLLNLLIVQLAYCQPAHNKKVVGYYAQWAIYARDYNVWNIDASKLTHLNYSFFGISYNAANPGATSLLSLDTYADFDHNEGAHPWDAPYKGNFADLKKLKELNPHLKILISVGGWTKSQNFSPVCANDVARLALVNSMITMMNTYPWIDGFDIDWEYPVIGGTDGTELLNGGVVAAQLHSIDDHKNLVKLVKDMRSAFPAGKLVTAALGNNVVTVVNQYIGNNNQAQYGLIDNIATYCDYVTYFGYDFGGNWNDKTAYNAPLYGSGNTNDPMHSSNANEVQSLEVLTNKFLNNIGIPANKLVMGLPFYGKLFKNVATGSSPIPSLPGLFVNAPRDAANGCNNPRPPMGTWDSAPCETSGSIEYCDLAGVVGTNAHHYLNIDGTLKSSAQSAGWAKYWDNTCKVPYLYNAALNQFISYDDQQSITEKVNFINSLNLAGGMVWELSQDERTTSALLSTINSAFNTTPVDFTVNFKLPNNTAVQGVQVTLTKVSDNSTQILTSNASGQVVFLDKNPFTQYNISYNYGSYYFSPTSISIPQTNNADQTFNVVLSDQVSQLSGSVRDGSNNLISNVIVKLIKTSDNSEIASVSSTDGNFSFSNVINGLNYKLKAEKQYYNFTDYTISNLSGNINNIIITGNLATYSISGTVYNGSQPFSGVLITLTFGTQSLTTTTNSSGNYTFNNLSASLNYTITPSLAGQNFQPANFTVNQLSQNVVQNFNANNYLVSGTVKNGSTPVSGANIEMVLPWTSNTAPYVALNATTDAQGKYHFENTVFQGYTQILSIKMNAWQNGGMSYYPATYPSISVPTTPTVFNFNSQPQAIEFAFTNLTNNSSVTIANGSPLVINSTANMLINDGATITSVVYTINGTNYNAINTSGNIYNYSWVFPSNTYNQSTAIGVTVTASNGMTYTGTINVTILCSGVGCPNNAPTLTWVEPVNLTINQASGFQPILVKVSASDSDGTISNVSLTINGGTSQNMTLSGGYYTYTFTPSAYSQYIVNITATDNQGGAAFLSKTISVVNSVFTPLPSGNIILGYVHSWENASAPFLYFSQIANKKFNVVVYSFIETLNGNGYTPQLTINTPRYLTGGNFDPQLLKNDIATLKALGIPVIVSIGGQNGHVELNTTAQKNEFVNGVKAIIDQYGFDGIDLDFEGGSMNFGAGALTNFSYANLTPYPKLKNVVDAFKELKQHYGNGFIMTCAPETYYVQVGYSVYDGVAGSFLPVIDNLRNELDLIMVQLYNTGSITSLNGQPYFQATPDFLSSMSDMLIHGFNVASTGYHFDGLPASKIMVGIPACSSAAPSGGYIQPAEAKKALDYLRFGTTFPGRAYTLQGNTHPALRGVMTWSVNWDVTANCASADEFGNFYCNYFQLPNCASLNTAFFNNSNEIIVYANNQEINVKLKNSKIKDIMMYDISGRNIYSISDCADFSKVFNFYGSKGIYIITVTTDNGEMFSKKILID